MSIPDSSLPGASAADPLEPKRAGEEAPLRTGPSYFEGVRGSFLLSELAVETPLEEVRRVLGKKLRSFETEEGGEKLEAYRRAFQLAEALILRRMGSARP